jgi:hypothetical protein
MVSAMSILPGLAGRRLRDRQICLPQSSQANVADGSRVPVGRLEQPTYRPQSTPAVVEKPRAAALKSKQLLTAVCLQQLYFETCRWQGDFLIDRTTGMGRDRPDRLILQSRRRPDQMQAYGCEWDAVYDVSAVGDLGLAPFGRIQSTSRANAPAATSLRRCP